MKISEKMIKDIIKEFCHDKLEKFDVINWHDAMRDYGCDKLVTSIVSHSIMPINYIKFL